MTHDEKFRAAARAALAAYEDDKGKTDPTDRFIDALADAASNWADAKGDERYWDGMDAERKVHFG